MVCPSLPCIALEDHEPVAAFESTQKIFDGRESNTKPSRELDGLKNGGDDPRVLPALATRWEVFAAQTRIAIRWLSLHTGLPAVLVTAIAVVLGYRILQKSTRFFVEIALVTALMAAATKAGFIRW